MKYTKSYFGHGKAPQVYRNGIQEVMADKSLSDAERGQALDVIEELVGASSTAGSIGAWRFAGESGAGTVSTKAMTKTGREMAPLAFDDESLHVMHAAVTSRQSLRVKAFNTAESHLPAHLMGEVVGPVHETRLLDRLPVMGTTAPSVEYVRHTSTTGSAAITAEGAAKPELVMNLDHVIATAQKIAAHTAVSYEILSDWSAFVGYVQGELFRQIIDAENAELLNGDGTTGHLTGLLHTSGILTHAVDTGNSETALDAIERSIATLRTGAALAEPDLLVLNPTTWSAIRRSKDGQGRYLTAPDPTADEANSCWGVDVLVTTTMTAGAGALIDSSKFGTVHLREGLTLQTGTANDDFTKNQTRFVGEERLALAVVRPAAVLSITGLPTA